jgi:elongation factor G
VLDGAVVVFCGVAGVQPQSETVWHQADKFKIPRIAFINKLDRVGASFPGVVADIRERLGANAVPIQLPIGNEDEFSGCIDLVRQKAIMFSGDVTDTPDVVDIPEELRAQAADARDQMIQSIADLDDAIAVKYLEGQDITVAELDAAIRKATIAVKMVPVCAGTALRNKGIHPLLDAVIAYLPSPVDVPPVTGVDPRNTDEKLVRHPKNNEPFAALAFKIAMDEGRKVVFIRVVSAAPWRPGAEDPQRPHRASKEKIARLFQYPRGRSASGSRRPSPARSSRPRASRKPRPATRSAIRRSPDPARAHRHLRAGDLAGHRGRQRRRRRSGSTSRSARCVEEDPTFRVTREDADTGQTLISRHGRAPPGDHRRPHEARVRGAGASAGKPQVVYRETVLREGEGTAVFERTGGEGKIGDIYGEATCVVRARARGTGMEFKKQLPMTLQTPPLNDVVVNAAMQGLKDAASSGPDGYPLEDVEVTLTKLTLKEGANGEIGSRAAASEAFRRAVLAASPSRLEPIMAVEVTVDEEYMGAVIGDLNQRRGHVQDVGERGAKKLITAHVPLRNMFGYSTRLRSLTEGRATFSMLFHAYDTLSS